ncbi:MAG: LytTR family transcriptional regulator DNA-binding domain-containing protein [Kordia sp.]|uniref:ligand-binding sensor domain-containing protein n=1 Tax=Kordia sp. TaxID=1965332 RepID=UPI00385B4808
MKHYQLFIFLFFGLNFCHAQQYTYKQFGLDDGLPSSQVYDIYQSKQGYVWFTTDKGLSRYNGYEFENFTTKDGLPDNVTLDFFPQKNGEIWCYGYETKKIFYFNENFDGFKEFQYNDKLKPFFGSESIVKSLVIDKNKTIHLGGYRLHGSIEITKNGQVTNSFDKYDKDDIGVQRSISFNLKKKNFFIRHNSYAATENILNFVEIDTSSSRIKFDILNDKQSIAINDNDLYIFSTDNATKVLKVKRAPIGIKRIDDAHFFIGYYNNGAEVKNVSGEVLKTFLPKKSVTNFFIDAEGGYWFSTLHHGVFYLKNPDMNVLSKEHFYSLTRDTERVLYAGSNNGNIIKIHQNKIDTIYKALNTHKTIVAYDTINNHLYSYSDRGFKNHMALDLKFEGFVRKIPENVANPLLKLHSNRVVIVENDSLKDFFIEGKLRDVCMYKNTTLIGTSNGLLIKKDSLLQKDSSFNFLKLRINDIDTNRKRNTAYIATHGAGVVVYGNQKYAIDEDKGLTSNIVNEVCVENDSIVWACTNIGLNRISFQSDETYTITTITKDDGLLSNDINDVEIINDTIWVATKNGLCYFKKDIIVEKYSSKILSLVINEVKVNSKIIDTQNIKLPYDQNDISFSLQAISQKNASKISYVYRLKEVDANWTYTKNRNIRFPSLSPGNYTFQVKASVLNNVDDTIVTYKFKIGFPFWKTWWFYGICMVFIGGIVYLFFKIRVLSYNKDIIRELIRLAIKRLKRKEKFLHFRSNGEDFKIPTYEILFIKSQGNYLDIITEKKNYTIRCKIGDFIATTPDVLEYLRIHRSYIIRIDQVSSKGKNWVVIKEQKIPVGETYLNQLEKIQF